MKFNKKGDIPSVLFVIVIIVFVGILLFILSDLTSGIFSKINNVFNLNSDLNNSIADLSLEKAQTYNNSMWDYFFLFIALGYAIFLMFLAFSVLTDIRFVFLYIIFVLFGLFIGAGLSNMWQKMVENPAFSTTLTKFPITDALLGNFYVIFIASIVLLSIILLFGKFGQGGV